MLPAVYLVTGLLTVDIIWLIAVAALWGFTNPFLKKGGKGIEHVQSGSRLLKPFYELLFLASNWKVCCTCTCIYVIMLFSMSADWLNAITLFVSTIV